MHFFMIICTQGTNILHTPSPNTIAHETLLNLNDTLPHSWRKKQDYVWKFSLNWTYFFQIDYFIINVVLITQRGVFVHLPTMVYTMGPFGGKHVFVNGHDYLRHKCGDTFPCGGHLVWNLGSTCVKWPFLGGLLLAYFTFVYDFNSHNRSFTKLLWSICQVWIYF